MPVLGHDVAEAGWMTVHLPNKAGAYGPQFTLTTAARLLYARVYARSINYDELARIGAYKFVDGLDTSRRRGQTAELTITHNDFAWYGADFSPQPVVPPGNYALALKTRGDYDVRLAALMSGGVNTANCCIQDDWFPDSIPSDPYGADGTLYPNRDFSIYAVYEEVKLGGDEGMGARAVLPILVRQLPRLKPLRI